MHPSASQTKTNQGPWDDTPVHVRVKLAAAWAALTLLYVYVDYFTLYKPGYLEGILAGKVWEFNISEGFFVFGLVLVGIPAVMTVLSVALPATVTRWTNLILGVIYIPPTIFNIAGGEWIYYYGLGIIAEVAILVFIIRCAWTWPRRDERIHPMS